jgi:hypothetical protein
MKFDILSISPKCVAIIQVLLRSDKNNGTLHEDRYTLLIISRSVLRRINVSDKSCRENQNTHYVFNNFFVSKIVPFVR